MLRLSHTAKFGFALLCVLAVLLRVTGVHAHYCLDGSEPPVTFHVADDYGAHHDDEHSGAVAHTDFDVSVSDDALVKKSTLDFDLLALLAIVFATLLVLQPARFIPAPYRSATLAPAPFVRPPSRGPPR